MTSIEIDGLLQARSFGDGAVWLVGSGALHDLTIAGLDRLAGLGVTLVLDLGEPTPTGIPAELHAVARVLHLPLHPTASDRPVPGAGEHHYAALVRDGGAAIATAVAAVADADGSVLLHCAAGEHPAELVLALALLLAGTPREEILTDMAVPTALVDPARGAIEALRQALELVDEFGGPHAYLLRHGMTPQQLTRIRDRGAAARDLDLVDYTS